MSSFMGRAMILLLVVDLNRSFASIYYDNNTDTEYEVISVEKKKFQIISIMDLAPFQVTSITKFGQFFAVLCIHKNWIRTNSHIRIYEDRHPFNLPFVIYTGELESAFDVLWNKKTESLFMHSDSEGVWQIRWEDHLPRKFSCPSAVNPEYMSISKDGHVLVIGKENTHLYMYVCNMNEDLIRKIGLSFVQTTWYTLQSPFGEYSFDAIHYDARLKDQMDSPEVELSLNERIDSNIESILDVNRTDEWDSASANKKRFSLFTMNYDPENCNDFHWYNVTIERRINVKKNLTIEYSASDENLVDVFLQRIGNRFFYGFNSKTKRCFDPWAQIWRRDLSVSYYYDNDDYRLIVVFMNTIDYKSQKTFIFRAQQII